MAVRFANILTKIYLNYQDISNATLHSLDIIIVYYTLIYTSLTFASTFTAGCTTGGTNCFTYLVFSKVCYLSLEFSKAKHC